MIENVIGKLSLPLGIVPLLQINRKQYMIPMCTEEPSVVAATSSIGKFITPYSFNTSSTPNVMVGQVHLPAAEVYEVNQIIRRKTSIIAELNQQCAAMVKRGGGVKDIRVREIENKAGEGDRNYSLDVLIDVCEAMGANLTNTLAEKAKEIVSKMGIKTGISVLSNYCL
jgi:degradative hydroxymethylglutaryl-CoA reductase